MPFVRRNIFGIDQTVDPGFCNIYFRDASTACAPAKVKGPKASGKRAPVTKVAVTDAEQPASPPQQDKSAATTEPVVTRKPPPTASSKSKPTSEPAKPAAHPVRSQRLKDRLDAAQMEQQVPKPVTIMTVTAASVSVTEAGDAPPKKKRFVGWAKLAKELAKAPGIDEMRVMADEHCPLLLRMPSVEKYIQTALNWDTCDELAFSLMPLTKSAFCDRFVPIWTSGNGNCFFNALSRVAYGHEGHSSDLRT